MRKHCLTLVLLSFFMLSAFNVWSSNLADKLLNMPITLLSGEQISLIDYKDKQAVYLKFWATWCQPCLKEMPHFQHVQQQYNTSIKTIGINLGIHDDEASVKALIDKFSLTMPTAIDDSGDLAKAFNFVGTPYHLLFDKQMNLVHVGHQANESLDNKLSLLSQSASLVQLPSDNIKNTEISIDIDADNGQLHALYFTATWCDWYLVETRPEVSKNCIDGQKNMNQLSQKFTKINWHGIVSRLWTGKADLEEYKKKYNIKHLIKIDKSNHLFHQYNVKQYPTLILLKNDQVVYRTSNFSNKANLEHIAELTKQL
ncbi:redoxin domain-containing protein [Thalassotalea sp. 1_MG-2023]|uniref:TlpA family protein disulfide reductase n=1 Tax=Thalassotalea sp. 1_MG-2023 TaxID=3062680 RepID=UPI0026E2368C|nr:redoxin domain-containing protein [Thalassotalea sp. 1_MG-2023]MDO6428256.1 redoxin domain-containing protein [Thalassotalea sp. 1_MG-2023]